MKKTFIAFAIVSMMIASTSNAAVTVVRVAPVTTVKVAPSVRVSQPVRASSTLKSSFGKSSSHSSTPIPLYVPLVIAATSGHSTVNAKETATEVSTPMLTICTIDEAEKAKVWQEDCKNIADYSHDVSENHCPILSYFRYCKEATPDEVKNLKPLKDNYKHVYLKE